METLGRLVGGIAHDFNNQLTVILGYAELLAIRLNAQQAETALVEQIRKAGQRAAGLTRQLLGFSRRRSLDLQVIDLGVILCDLEPAMKRLLGDTLQLQVVAPRSLAHVRMDRGQFEQVVMNLAVNARDAMPGGGQLRIELRAVPVTSGDGFTNVGTSCVSLQVSDTGEGIVPTALDRIFEPFFTTKPDGIGTGLGLSTVRRIVQQSGGAITVDSTPGAGTTFTVLLPRAGDQAAIATPDALRRRIAGTETVLIVEDEPDVRRITRLSLEEHGYRVIDGANAFQAVEAARHHAGRIDLLLSDISMPDMDGPSLAQRIVAMQPDIRVMYVSGFPVDVDAHRLSKKVSFLAKPFTPERLAGKVRAVLDARVA